MVQRGIRQIESVVRRFDDHLVRADAVHLVIGAEPLAVEPSLDPEGRKFVGNHADFPSGLIRAGAVSDRGNFRRSFAFVPLAERADPSRRGRLGVREIIGPAAAFRGNDDPASLNRIVSKFRHTNFQSSLHGNAGYAAGPRAAIVSDREIHCSTLGGNRRGNTSERIPAPCATW